MTAEIAILNRSAVALGADSAATVRRKIDQFTEETKVFKGANKIFGLSRTAPIGVMIFGDATFMGVPWETLVKAYRAHLQKRTFDTLGEYCSDFFQFLENHPHLFPDSDQDNAILGAIIRYALRIQGQVDEGAGIRERNRQLRARILEHYEFVLNTPFVGDLDEKQVKSLIGKHDDKLDFVIDHVFSSCKISKPNRGRLKRVLTASFTHLWYADAASGIVFAGFGETEFFPQLKSFYCDGVYENRCSYVKDADHAIEKDKSSDVVPFAQKEMVETFMYGYDPTFETLARELLHESFEEFVTLVKSEVGGKVANHVRMAAGKIEQKFQQTFVKWVIENHYAPIRRIVDVLSKDELADLVETLITIESVKKRITSPVESVAGPVDVAVISKSEGLVWIKRKHYFEADRNFEYFERVRTQINE